MNYTIRDTILLGACFCVAALQVVGFSFDSRGVRGVGIVTTASPLPFVFSAHNGLETFAQSYAVELVELKSGVEVTERIRIDAGLYSRLGGAYNLRNAYGAIFSHGPVFAVNDVELIDSIAAFGLCQNGPLLQSFAPTAVPMRVILESKPHDPQKPVWRHEFRCP